jgi:anti-sigma factor RsiW
VTYGSEHVGENAALYVLGALDEDDRRAIDEHASSCEACAAALEQAGDDLTAIAAAQQQFDAPAALGQRVLGNVSRGDVVALTAPRAKRTWWFVPAAAIAAAFLIGILPSAYFWQQSQGMHAAMRDDAEAMNRLAATPFRTASFGGMNGTTAARVMYAPDGTWYVVLVKGASKALAVAWMHDGRRTMLGAVRPHGDVAMLYLPQSHRMDTLALVDGDRVVGEAQLAY